MSSSNSNNNNPNSNRSAGSGWNAGQFGIRGFDGTFMPFGGAASTDHNTRPFDMDDFLTQGQLPPLAPEGEAARALRETFGIRLGPMPTSSSSATTPPPSEATSTAKNTQTRTRTQATASKGTDEMKEPRWFSEWRTNSTPGILFLVSQDGKTVQLQDFSEIDFPEGFSSKGTGGENFYADGKGRFIVRELTEAEKATAAAATGDGHNGIPGMETYGSKFGEETMRIVNDNYLRRADGSGGIEPGTPWRGE